MRKHSAVLGGCLFVIAACGESGGVPVGSTPMTMTPTAGTASGGTSGSTSAMGASGSTGTAGMSTSSGGSGGKSSGTGGTGGGGGGPAPVTAIAHIMPLASATAGAGGSGGSGASGSSGGSAGASSGSAGGSAASGGITGTALFTKIPIGVQLKIDVSGCMDGLTYPVHIHEGMSCDNAMRQGGHWGAVTAAAGSGGSSAGAGGSSAGAGGHSAGAGGSSAGAGGSGGAAGGATPMMLRGEGIPDIKCMGTMGSTAVTRSTPDARIAWSIGDASTTDVVGHVIVVHNAAGDRIACGKIMMQ